MIGPRSFKDVVKDRQLNARIRLSNFEPHETCVPDNAHWPVCTGAFGASYTSATWIPTGFLLVSGDAEAVVFGRYTGMSPAAMLRSVASSEIWSVCRKAASAMTPDAAYETDDSAALEGLEQVQKVYLEGNPDDRTAEEYGWLTRAIERIRKQHSTAEREIADVYRNTSWNVSRFGEVPSRRVVYAHEFCRRLVRLFDEMAEEDRLDSLRLERSREHRAKLAAERGSGLHLVRPKG